MCCRLYQQSRARAITPDARAYNSPVFCQHAATSTQHYITGRSGCRPLVGTHSESTVNERGIGNGEDIVPYLPTPNKLIMHPIFEKICTLLRPLVIIRLTYWVTDNVNNLLIPVTQQPSSMRLIVLLVTLLAASLSQAKIMRNNALLSKMMSDYKDKTHQPTSPPEDQGKPAKILSLMQNVLCRNFPAIPCKLITQDEKLRQLIQESIQEIKYKRDEIAPTEPPRGYEPDAQYTIVNSEDLSNFLQVRNTGYFEREARPKHARKTATKKVWVKSPGKTHMHHDFDTPTVYGKKKIRKFYPHKVKYKDKHEKRQLRTEHGQDIKLHSEPSYRAEVGDAPVWRIDYTKHGEPRFNLMGADEPMDSMKNGRSVIADQNGMDGMPRTDVMHSDVYIKKKYPKKVDEFASDGF